jgi:hypothetical protein
MEIGTIGAGDFAQAFAKRALKAGHKVRLSNSRGPESPQEIVHRLGPGAVAATKEEAAGCEMLNNMIVPNLDATPSSMGRDESHLFRPTMTVRRGEFKAYLKVLAIQSLTLETSAMEG